jgi:hypothetical protein
MTEFVTTLNKIREHSPCIDGWRKLLKSLNKETADDEPLPFRVILESNGLDDALWCTRTTSKYAKGWRLYSIRCARRVQHLMTDNRSINAIDIAESYVNGKATADAVAAAREGALEALREGARVGEVAESVTRAIVKYSIRDTAWAAAREEAWAAAREAVQAMARRTVRVGAEAWNPSWDAAQRAAEEAAWEAARAAQEAEFLRIISGSTN